MELSTWLKKTFKDRHYRAVVINEEITVYCTFGEKEGENGAFATTVPATNRITSKIDSALLPKWKNSRQYESVVEIPKGTELNRFFHFQFSYRHLRGNRSTHEKVYSVNPLSAEGTFYMFSME